MSDRPKPIRPSAHTLDRLLTDCEGHVEYVSSGGRALPGGGPSLVRLAMSLGASVHGFTWLVCKDVFAMALKPAGPRT